MANRKKFRVSDDITDNTNAINSVGTMTRRRPCVSAKKPHNVDEQIMPKNDTAPSTPFSFVVRCKSHCDIGIMYATPHVSMKTEPNIMPAMVIMK